MIGVWHDGYEWYVEKSAADARAAQLKLIGEDSDDSEFWKVPYWKIISIYADEYRQKRPRRLWAWLWIIINRQGFLASTEW